MKAVAVRAPMVLALLMSSAELIAEPAAGLQRIGILYEDPQYVSHGEQMLRQTLRDLGYVEGQTIAYEHRRAAAKDLDRGAQELVRSGVDLLITSGTPSTLAAKRASKTVPIVFYAADPVGTGLALSLAHPGQNATGVATLSDETGSKRLELVKELLPRAAQIGVLVNLANPASLAQLNMIESTAGKLRMKMYSLGVRSEQDLERTLALVTRQHYDAIVILADGFLAAHYALIAGRMIKSGVPSISGIRQFPEAGGLSSYGADPRALWRQVAIYADKILKGAKPGNLPIEQPTKFELVVNLKTAKALGITVPESIMQRADEVIR